MDSINPSALREIDRCEVCSNDHLTPVLDLGLHPLCDDLVPVGDPRICREYPIEILFCENCRTAHQRFQIPKRELFPPSYHYRARFTADVLKGMASLVDACEERSGSLKDSTVLDLGCNDGSLLDFFRARGAKTLGVEPTDAAEEAEEKGHVIFRDYLSEELAETIAAAHGQPDFITFTNVFAHIENLREVIAALKRLSGAQTVVVIENHYLGAVLEGNQFDTFYHEHARTYSYTSFLHLAESLNVKVLSVEFPERYGGNIRVFFGHGDGETQARADIELRERRFPEKFKHLQQDVTRWRETRGRALREEVHRVGKLAAKAFPARAAILIKLLGLDEEQISAVYEKPGSLKIGHYVPGTRIPIRSDEELLALADQTRPLLNLAWHIPQEIRSYMAELGYTGSIVDILSKDEFETGLPT